jgi:hypothetical protein
MIIVVDLDGTLCNSGHREHLARAKQWDEFHSLLSEDEPWPDVAKFISSFDIADDTIFIGLTGRNERYRPATLDWLFKHDLHLDSLLMRPDNDFNPDHELKPQMLDRWLESEGLTHADVWLILEDREKVVEAWRNIGHNCWQVRASGY